jgi:phosphoglycerol transferase MdoB-like AlkP superfamily enzyme
MTYEQHGLAVDALHEWALALFAAVRLYWLFALVWYVATRDPVEGAVVFAPSLLALVANQVMLLRARWHVRKMRAHLDGLKVRR